MVYTDEAAAYEGIPHRSHRAVKHSAGEYVKDMASTNGVESFWALLKRGVDGTHHHVSVKHLGRYVGEFAGRHNLRPLDTDDMMSKMATGSVDKFHFAITGQTAAQIILERADAQMSNMGLTTMSSEGPTTQDVTVGKNYLTADELQGLENISEQFLLFAESKAFRGHKMVMEELATKLNVLLMANDYPVLYEYNTYMRDQADKHAKKQLSVYRAQLDAPRKKALNVGESDITDKSERNKEPVGRPPKPLPEIASSPEAAAKAVISLPPDHEWRYTKDEAENVQ